MKTLIKTTLIALSLALSLPLLAQDNCNAYFPMEEGTVFEMTSYNDKDKEQGMTRNTIQEVTTSEGSIEATVKVQSLDKKGNETYTSEYGVSCHDGKFHLDMRSMMNEQNMASMQDVQFDVEADDLAFPLNAEPGTTLPDAHLKVTMQSTGFTMGGLQVNVTNRKVIARETITTPAGTFDCVVITQDEETHMIVPIKASSKTWYAKGAGTVRNESYNKNGKLMGYEVLTRLEN